MSELANWTARRTPNLRSVHGRYVSIEPVCFPRHANELYEVIGGSENDALWSHVAIGPWKSAALFGKAMELHGKNDGWITHQFRDANTATPLGMSSYMRNRPEQGSTEVGCVVFSRKLQRTAAATEAMYLMAKHVFDDLGYRRYEWECNNANEPSKRAALRLGFTFEGIFRQDMVVKGQNRDTAWFSITNGEWPLIRAAFEAWLDPANFDTEGVQKRSLANIRAAL